jgi:acetyl esterase/lipase
MKVFALLMMLVCTASVFADEPQTIDVWPGVAPGEKADAPPEQWGPAKPGAKPSKRVTGVTHPTLTIFRPEKDKDTGVAVIVAPGGGYKALMMDYEGEDVAKWLNTIGVTGVVLKYRVPGHENEPKYLAALQDAQRTVSLVRSKAAEWRIKPDHIGFLGFSAGGHLTAAVSTNFDKPAYPAIDSVDQVSSRPDFSVVVYPGGILDKDTGKLSAEIRVSSATPPAFIVQATDDRVNSENSAYYYLALNRAGVKAELHLYATGGHGFGMKPTTQPVATWPQRLEAWMHSQKVLAEPVQ